MKISYNWLKEYINVDIDVEELSEILTNIGLEVEGIENYEEVKGGLKGLVTGHVLTCEQHPNADKLSKTTVDVGTGEVLPIVCGAPNVAAGQKVIVATVGTTLYSGDESFEIKKAKIRGEVSEGMICAEDEIGLGTSHDGIMVLPADTPVGIPAATYFDIESDKVFEIGLTPNRVDASSHFGVARDLRAYFSMHEPKELKLPDVSAFKPDNTSHAISVEVKDTEACKRYAGITISGITVSESPKWLKNRLKAIGLAPINNVVDITNFVLHEMGQPLHAFDADQLSGGKIVVQKLPSGTPFVTLDEKERKLDSEDLMICDASAPTCIAGVFGGLHSGVSEQTKTIFLESAYFDPVSVRKTAKRHALNTDASFRFERGIDPNITVIALKRAAMLIREIAGGKITSEVTDIYPSPIEDFEVKVKYAHIDRLIGKKIDHELIENLLESLDVTIVNVNCEEMYLRVPSYRVDVTREADVIEDILRLVGYNSIEIGNSMHVSIAPSQKPDNEERVNAASELLVAQGFTEIMSNSLTRKAYYEKLESYPSAGCVEILNPLSSDLNVLRQTLIFSGLEAVARNINFKNPNLRLFEYGRCYWKTGVQSDQLDQFSEERRFGFFITGLKEFANWNTPEQKVSFFDLKATIEQFLAKNGIDVSRVIVEPLTEKQDMFDGGVRYKQNKQVLAEVGMVQPTMLEMFEIEQPVAYAELYWDVVLKQGDTNVLFTELPRHLPIRRDLALLVDDTISYQDIKEAIWASDRRLIKSVELFDSYKGKGIPEGKKSYGVAIVMQDAAKTLTDKEIDKPINKIIAKLQQQFNAELR